jgi:glucose/arabinose dehydrogenase
MTRHGTSARSPVARSLQVALRAYISASFAQHFRELGPYSYYGQHVDERVKPPRPDLVAKAIPPDYALGPHAASLGLVFYDGKLLPAHYANGAFVGQHGSWNRKPRSGYKVIFVPFSNGRPAGDAEDS